MKKIFISAVFALICAFSFGQGFQNMIVEQVDASAAEGGNTAYRVYIDMAPGYQLQAVFGNDVNPTTISTTTDWYNSAFGGTIGNSLSSALFGTFPEAVFDSYISMNAASSSDIGVPTADDTDGTADGLTAGTIAGVTEAGISTASNFGAGGVDNTFAINTAVGGAWSTTDDNSDQTPNNTVLIGQFTTDGDFTLSVNIQIRSAAGVVETYEASTTAALNFPAPVTGCTDASSCNYNAAASVDDGSCDGGPVDACDYCTTDDGTPTGTPVTDGSGVIVDGDINNNGICDVDENLGCTDNTACNFDASANVDDGSCLFPGDACDDGDATTANDVFQSDCSCAGVVIPGCTDATACNFDATATVDDGSCIIPDAQCEICSGGVAVLDPAADANNNGICDALEAGYLFGSVSQTCDDPDFCLPLQSKIPITDVNGFDLTVNYDPAQVTPTGNIIVYAQTDINPSDVGFNTFIPTAGTMFVSVYLLPSAPSTSMWDVNQLTDILCIEFITNAGFTTGTSNISLPEVIESHVTTPFSVLTTNTTGDITVSESTVHNGNLQFWNGFSPIQYDSNNPATYAVTDVFGNDNTCANQSGSSVNPDLVGTFVYDAVNGDHVEIIRDVPNTASVLSVINGFDALLTLQVTLNQPNTFNDFQFIAMDVNRDGGVTAGDVSQINQRTVLEIGEYSQVNPQRDWIFVDATSAANFGVVDRFNVPIIDLCVAIPAAVDCQIPDEDYIGILLGDVDGSWSTLPVDGVLKAFGKDESTTKNNDQKVIIDLVNAEVTPGYITVPVAFESPEAINTLDFEFQFNTDLMNYDSYEALVDLDFESVNYNEADLTLRATTGSLVAFEDTPVMNVTFAVNGDINVEDFVPVTAVINGVIVPIEVSFGVGVNDINVETSIFPNPTNDVVNITVSDNAFVQVLDVTGKAVLISTNVNANQLEQIDMSALESGMYLINVYGDNFSTFEKIVKK